ncbi:MAG TPA: STAS domain-containing protein [Gammaproteobacteria bacterium]
MPLTINRSDDGQAITIKINGRFDFDLHQEFRQAFEHAEDQQVRYVIDLAEAEYMDSSALGMLLLLRERAGGDRADIAIVNCSPAINKILTISNFHKLFKVA